MASLLAISFILIPLFRDGMFMDGVLYSAVASNLAKGHGSFWDPSFSPTLYPHFHEQPPFGLWLQSLFFWDGASRFPERIFDFLVFLFTVIGMLIFWKSLHFNYSSWPILLWISIPTVQWGIVNNVLEQPMAFFDLLSVFFFWKNFQRGTSPSFVFISLALFFLFLASFTKGIQGLFPLVAPIIFAFIFRRNYFSAFISFLIVLVGIILAYALLIRMIPSAMDSYKAYFVSRFDGFPNTRHANTEYRIALLATLLLQLGIPILLSLLVRWFNCNNENGQKSIPDLIHPMTYAFFLIGASASLPIMLTHEQRGFYLNTSMPFYSMGLACWSYANLSKIEAWLLELPKVFGRICRSLLLFLGLAVCAFFIFLEIPKRDNKKLTDMKQIAKAIYPNERVGVDSETWSDWGLQNYFMRNHAIALDPDTSRCLWYLMPMKKYTTTPNGFEGTKVKVSGYYLFRRKSK